MRKKIKLLVCLITSLMLAFIVPVHASKSVGVAAAVNQNALSKLPGGKIKTMVLGNKVYFKQRIDTQGVGIVQLLFSDGSTIMVGANSSLVIDEYIYDPKKGTGKLAISFGKGVMRFIGGKISKQKNGVTVRTAVGTAGIRGGMANIGVSGNRGVFSFLFGKDLTFKGLNGEARRIYTQGYTLLANKSQGRSYKQLVIRRTLRGDTEQFARRFTGARSQQGGARQRPTSNQVSKSAVSRGGSKIPFPRVKPKDLPNGVVGTPRFDLERDRLDVAPDFDYGAVCSPYTSPPITGSPSIGTPPLC